jgi:LAS superfamily LD-carboxypeptidase LdcB
MKLNAHNNPQGKHKAASPSQTKPKQHHHDPAVTERNRLRRIAKDKRMKEKAANKVLHTPHGAARFQRYLRDKILTAQIKEEERAVREVHDDLVITSRDKAIALGIIVPHFARSAS